MNMYTVLREDGYYPDSRYNKQLVTRGLVCKDLKNARLWQHKKAAHKYASKFGGNVIEIKVIYERVS